MTSVTTKHPSGLSPESEPCPDRMFSRNAPGVLLFSGGSFVFSLMPRLHTPPPHDGRATRRVGLGTSCDGAGASCYLSAAALSGLRSLPWSPAPADNPSPPPSGPAL
jgi:hypothetical protein